MIRVQNGGAEKAEKSYTVFCHVTYDAMEKLISGAMATGFVFLQSETSVSSETKTFHLKNTPRFLEYFGQPWPGVSSRRHFEREGHGDKVGCQD